LFFGAGKRRFGAFPPAGILIEVGQQALRELRKALEVFLRCQAGLAPAA
jgi:hypothetical protein